jgi:hypothetical protein
VTDPAQANQLLLLVPLLQAPNHPPPRPSNPAAAAAAHSFKTLTSDEVALPACLPVRLPACPSACLPLLLLPPPPHCLKNGCLNY